MYLGWFCNHVSEGNKFFISLLCCTGSFGPTYFGQGSTLNLSAPGSPALVRQGPGRWNSNANIIATQNGPGFGLRSIAISPDARHFAIGDRSGQLRYLPPLPVVYGVHSSYWTPVSVQITYKFSSVNSGPCSHFRFVGSPVTTSFKPPWCDIRMFYTVVTFKSPRP